MDGIEEKIVTEEPKKNDYCRKIMIKNYRNLGIGEPSYMTINRSLDKDKLGGLNIVVGPNNCGKSNVLDAIESLSKGITSDDEPDFYSIDEKLTPSVRMTIYDNGEKHFSNECAVKKQIATVDWGFKKSESELAYSVNNIIYKGTRSDDEKIRKYCSSFNKVVEKNLVESVIDISKNIPEEWIKFNITLTDRMNYNDVLRIVKESVDKYKDNKDTSGFSSKYGFSMNPNIIRYKENKFTQNDLKSSYKPFNDFMKKVLDLTFGGKGIKKVAEAFEKYESSGMIGNLRRVETDLNKEAEEFSRRFNKLYLTKNQEYSFRFSLMENNIIFTIFMGEEEQSLNRMSTGFRWFFDFFFNFLCDRSLNPGDLVIMDEPATNLHVSGQMELREFMREFAINTGVTFIISTHSPFLINCDHLDELRIVTRKDDGTSTIYDKFTVVDPKNPDQMDQILNALTIGRHVIMDPNDKVFFVEGITDYNYFTAFKLLFGIKGVTFLPINGAGEKDDEEQRKRVITGLMKISRSPVLIVDGDSGGERMIESAKGTGLEVISISECDGRFHTVESMFSKDDRKKFIPVKEWHSSSIFKQYIMQEKDNLSDVTKSNFRKFFKYILDGVDNE